MILAGSQISVINVITTSLLSIQINRYDDQSTKNRPNLYYKGGSYPWPMQTAVHSPGLCPVPGLHAGRAQKRPESQMGVSFPAIQGGRDLRPPLRAPI